MIEKRQVLNHVVHLLGKTFIKPSHVAVLKDVIMHHQRFPLFIKQLHEDVNRLELMGRLIYKDELELYMDHRTIQYATLIMDRLGKKTDDEDHPKPELNS